MVKKNELPKTKYDYETTLKYNKYYYVFENNNILITITPLFIGVIITYELKSNLIQQQSLKEQEMKEKDIEIEKLNKKTLDEI